MSIQHNPQTGSDVESGDRRSDQTKSRTRGPRLRRILNPATSPGPPINPALLEHAKERAQKRENRFADRVTAFAGSMRFVYLHAIWFSCWIGFGVEAYPYGLLTMIVSLEAIFLSTFVLISQNRADTKRQVLADQQWTTVQKEEEQNVELLDVSRQILTLTKEVHSVASSAGDWRGESVPIIPLEDR